MNDELEKADEILHEYAEPNSMVDSGNLFFAATEYRKAYQRQAERAKVLVEAVSDYLAYETKCVEEYGPYESNGELAVLINNLQSALDKYRGEK